MAGLGKPPPMVTACAKVSPELMSEIDVAAARSGVSRSEWIGAAIILALDGERAAKTPVKIQQALPVRTRTGIRLPGGRTYDRF